MDTLEAIKNRRSIRKYTTKELSKEDILELIEFAKYAPSSHNRQPWNFTVVVGKEKIDSLSADINKWYDSYVKLGTPLSFIKEIKKSVNEMRKRVESENDLFFYHAPAVVLVHAPSKKFFNQDCAAAAQNMMLAARAKEIGSCWIGFSDIAFNRSSKIRKKWKIPVSHRVMASVALGYPLKFPEKALPRREASVEWVE